MIRATSAIALVAVAGSSLVADSQDVGIQIVSLDAQTTIRVLLERKPIYEGKPELAPFHGLQAPLPVVAGKFPLTRPGRHTIIAEASATGSKAQFEWNLQDDPSPWVVIRYYPGRAEPREPAFFTFARQSAPFLLK